MLSRVSVGLVAVALLAVSQDAMAQSRRSDNVRRAPVSADDRRWDRDDDRRRDRDDDRRRDRDFDRRANRDDDRRAQPDYGRWRNDGPPYGRARGHDAEWERRQRARHIEWCRNHRNDRRCADLYRRGNNWCWDRNNDNRCDNVDFRRRDSRGVLRADRGPDWERWLRASGVDVDALVRESR